MVQWVKGKTVHRTKKKAEQIQREYRSIGVQAKIIPLAKGYRVDSHRFHGKKRGKK